MPARLVVELDDAVPEPPERHGPALHGAVLAALGRGDEELARLLHPGEGRVAAPLTLTPAVGREGGAAFEMGFVHDELAARAAMALEHGKLEVGGQPLAVTGLGGVRQAFSEIAEQAPLVNGWTVTLRSPTCVRIPGGPGNPTRTEPLPNAPLLLERLRRRWAQWSDTPLPGDDQVREVSEDRIVCAAADVRTVRHTTKPPRGWAVGSVGTVVWTLLQPDMVSAPVRRGLSALFRLAALTGAGDHTSRGMGHVTARPATKQDGRGRGMAST